MRKRVLELGGYLAPAYAGMVLAEQGHAVEKWLGPRDPLLDLNHADMFWSWLMTGKQVINSHITDILMRDGDTLDIVIDNFRPEALDAWGVDPAALAREKGWVWVSLRSDIGGRSFDLIAQARSWMEYGYVAPFYLGDTAAGLWMAFKALATDTPGHYPIGQASCLQKLVEGELIMDVPRAPGAQAYWDPSPYCVEDGHAVVGFRDDVIREPARDYHWKRQHLWHTDGRIRI